ncbi:MAG: hydantoinase/oxoprolinase family protein [Nevskiaceae bacterium]|nr:MAG: hydantoinase/oxoprolinase family protein [Burkholderiaceae bacterium]TBR73791.1 MAG: hydantoinase/oxoprolinase family protein [Nevskiaceae bacterium]
MEICIDNGGTLTDFYVRRGDSVWATKTLTTPYDLSECFFDGLRKVSGLVYGDEDAGRLLAEASGISYSTTQGTNSLVERKGPRLGLVVPKGFDTARLAPSAHHRELFDDLIGPRIVAVDMDLGADSLAEEVIRCTNTLGEQGTSRIVVCLTGADYVHRESHYVAQYERSFLPHHLGTVPISMSHETTGDACVERRMWTAIFNAFLHGPMENFLFYAQQRLKNHRGAPSLRIFRNDGGTARVVKTTAVKTYSSGPRGGMEAAYRIAARRGYSHLVSVDVGGTTSDIGRVEAGEIHTDLRGEIEGVASSLELCNVVSAGVGGGSLIRAIDGKIKVGPESAGAAPGPACFGLGGSDATITDALLAIGLLDPETFFEGGKALDRQRAEAAIKAYVADPLGLSVAQAAYAMRDAWVDALAAALHEHTPPRADSVLLAFGGAGPMAICAVAEKLDIGTVFIPRFAAMLSAYGVSFGSPAQDYEMVVAGADRKGFERVSKALLERAERDMAADGLALSACRLDACAIHGEQVTAIDIHAPQAWPAEVDSIQFHVVAITQAANSGKAAAMDPAAVFVHEPGTGCPAAGERRVHDETGVETSIPVYRTFDARPGQWAAGPAVLEGLFYTAHLPAQWTLHVVEGGDLLLVRDSSH